MLGGIYILSLLFQCLEMLFRELIHPVFAFLKHKDYYFQPDSSLQTKFPRQGCIAPGFFILADGIPSAGMHRPRIFHPCRQNLLVRDASSQDFSSCRQNFLGRDASPRDFSSLRTESPRQRCIVSAIMPQASGRPRSPPSSPQFTSTLAGRTLIKPAVPIFKLSAFIPDDLFPVSRGTFRIQFRMTNSVSHDEFSLRMRPGNFSRPPVFIL